MKKQIPTNGRHTAKGYRGVQVRKDLRLAIYLRDGFHCVWCERDLHGAAPMDLTLDHLICDSKNGSNEPSNLVLACRTCNCTRQDTPWCQFAKDDAKRSSASSVTHAARSRSTAHSPKIFFPDSLTIPEMTNNPNQQE